MDVQKTKNVLQLVAGFADGDDRTFTIDNPHATVTAAQVNAVSDYIKEHNLLLGDKDSSDFARIKSAKIIEGVTTYYDLAI